MTRAKAPQRPHSTRTKHPPSKGEDPKRIIEAMERERKKDASHEGALADLPASEQQDSE